MKEYYFVNYLRMIPAPTSEGIVKIGAKRGEMMLQQEVCDVLDRHPFVFLKEEREKRVNVVIRAFILSAWRSSPCSILLLAGKR